VAWDWPDDVPAEVKQRRLAQLIELQNDIGRDKNRQLVGQSYEVLVEGRSDKDATRLIGRTRTNKLMLFPGELETYPAGSFVEVVAQEAFLWGFVGAATRIVSQPAAPRAIIELKVA
jgi:tRNA-2-methylthio-N6-dimethylallyladenosine synthase